MQKLVEKIFDQWKKQNIIVYKEDEKKVFARAMEALKEDIHKEELLDRDVMNMLDQLEKSNPGEFQRHKMFPMLKQKMAKERKMVL